MDPDACLRRIRDAFAAKDWDEFDGAITDLWQWIQNGGFSPQAFAEDEALRDAVLHGEKATRELLAKRAVEKVLGGRVLDTVTLDETDSYVTDDVEDEETH